VNIWSCVIIADRRTYATLGSPRQPGFPDKFLNADFPSGISIEGSSKCRWCLQGESENCGLHRQSPINLLRNRGVRGDPMEKECIDWHYIKYERGTCDWYDFQDQFEIMRHALRFSVPLRTNGDVDCEKDGKRAYPRTDYSKGFPNWWWLDHVDIQVPSNHVQEGKRYDAEVILAHFYEFGHEKNQVRTDCSRDESLTLRSPHTMASVTAGVHFNLPRVV
jgi:hypothetical protein